MKVTALTKFKHGAIYSAMRQLGWTQAELARQSGINQAELGRLVNMRKRPKDRQIELIVNAFGSHGVYLDALDAFPAEYQPTGAKLEHEETRDVPSEEIAMLLMGVSDPPQIAEAREYLDAAICALHPRKRRVIEMSFGLDESPKTLSDMSSEIGVTRERCRQIRDGAIGDLRKYLRMEDILETSRLAEAAICEAEQHGLLSRPLSGRIRRNAFLAKPR